MSAEPRIIRSSPRAQNRRRGPICACRSINPSRSAPGHLRASDRDDLLARVEERSLRRIERGAEQGGADHDHPHWHHPRAVLPGRTAAVAWASARGTITQAEATRLTAAKLVYGVGVGTYRASASTGHGPTATAPRLGESRLRPHHQLCPERGSRRAEILANCAPHGSLRGFSSWRRRNSLDRTVR